MVTLNEVKDNFALKLQVPRSHYTDPEWNLLINSHLLDAKKGKDYLNVDLKTLQAMNKVVLTRYTEQGLWDEEVAKEKAEAEEAAEEAERRAEKERQDAEQQREMEKLVAQGLEPILF